MVWVIKMFLNECQILDRILRTDKSRIVIRPIIHSNQFNPASFDLRLGTEFKIIQNLKFTHIEPTDSNVEKNVKEYTGDYQITNPPDLFVIHPDEFVLASTLEFVRLPNDIGAKLDGRSGLGRLGLMIHSTAGFVDPGFSGNLTYELRNIGRVPIKLYPGIRIGQISFFKIEPTLIPYKGGYADTLGVASSKHFSDIEYYRIKEKINAEKEE